MKKLIFILFALSITTTSVFAKNFFESRFFEINANVPVQISNNYFKFGDFQKGQDLVIDLREMADSLPKSGYSLIAAAQPEFGAKLSIGPFASALYFGLDVYGNVGIGKELFDFLGYGYDYQKKSDINVDGDVTLDAFMTFKAPVTIDVRRVRCTLSANAFIPIVHANSTDFKATVTNSDAGEFTINTTGIVNLYTVMDSTLLFDENGKFSFNPALLSGVLTEAVRNNAIGYDVSGSFDYRFSDVFMLTSYFSFPVIPGHLNYKTPVNCSMTYQTSVSGLMGSEGSSYSADFGPKACEASLISINRPLKINLGLEICPFETKWLIFNGMAGFGLRHPFSKVPGEAKFYPEYNASMMLSLASILKAKLSTSYMDQIFSQQFAFGINFRFIEFNAGIASQSSTFTGSFTGCGIGAYVNAAIGF